MKPIKLKPGAEFITLGQLLKHEGFVQTGGETKHFLEQKEIFVNGERETRRGKKLREGDRIVIDHASAFIVQT